ncbi:GerMN domain-containing protein [Bacillus piscicola]|uniref:GerMN domain-containing protein n=1 Tax=Bacillus piscicola TaxID=1632684 RepID=UPI001F08E350|nr:GerMN domain-containing protein [Bacillus piscicola]
MKHVYGLIALMLSIGLLTACGQGGDNTEDASNAAAGNETNNEQAVEEEEAEPAEDNTAEEDAATEEESSSEETSSDAEMSEEAASDDQEGEVSETVTLYFPDDQLLETYKEEQEVTVASEEELPKAALEAWVAGPKHDKLVTFFPEPIEVQSVEGEDDTAVVSFSKELLDTNLGSTGELFMTEQIALIMQQFGYEQTRILVDGEEQSTLFGHMDADEPFPANDPSEYETVE